MRQGQMRQRQMHPKLHLKFWQQHRCLVGEFIFEDTGSQPLPVVALELGHTTSIAWYCMFLNPGASQWIFPNSGEKDAKEAPIHGGCTRTSFSSKLLLVFFFWEAAITPLLMNTLLDCWWCPKCFFEQKWWMIFFPSLVATEFYLWRLDKFLLLIC